MRMSRWLKANLGVKRWLFLALGGQVVFSLGITLLAARSWQVLGSLENSLAHFLFRLTGRVLSPFTLINGFFLVGLGLFFLLLGLWRATGAMVGHFSSRGIGELAEAAYQKQHLARGPRLVVIGGGTGLATLLRGLKAYTANLTAIVTVADDGGSSGRLRREMGMLPPGDIRNCLMALAETEPLMERLFQHRFASGALAGHNFGNLFLASMTEVTGGDFLRAIREFSRVLAVRGEVLPATLSQVDLVAEYADGTVVRGEANIPKSSKAIQRVRLEPANPLPLQEALAAIAAADAIILGPGSLYTSIIPNLLVAGLPEAIKAAPGKKIYVCNVMTQPGETIGYRASDHVRALLDHAGPDLVEFALLNNAAVPPPLLAKYQLEGAEPVAADMAAVRRLGPEPVCAPLISETNLVRHHPEKLAAAIMDLLA